MDVSFSHQCFLFPLLTSLTKNLLKKYFGRELKVYLFECAVYLSLLTDEIFTYTAIPRKTESTVSIKTEV